MSETSSQSLDLTVDPSAQNAFLTDEPSKTLMLVGGNWQYPATEDPYGVSIYLDFLERSGGVENAKIGIFTTASSTGQLAKENGALYVQDFRDLYDLYLKDKYPNATIDVEWIPFHIGNAEKKEDNQALIEQIKGYTGIIFGGGDQSLITESFFDEDPVTGIRTETGVYKALKQKYEEGTVIAGTSAGTTVETSFPMITEGESYEALLNGGTSLIGSPPFVRDLYYNPLGGLGFFNYGLLDTHFSERGRQGRIIRLASDVGADKAFGVDENTALIVTDADTPNVNMQVLGQGGVFISDLSEATVDQSSGYWSIDNVKASYLTEGDQYNPLTRTATFGDKTAVQPEDSEVPTSTNIFSWKNGNGSWTDPRELTETAIDLVESSATTTTGLSLERQPVRYGVTLTETDESQGYTGTDSTGAEKTSFANLDVDIAPVYTAPRDDTEGEFIDLHALAGRTVAAKFDVTSDAFFKNTFGLYAVQNRQGKVTDPLTGKSLSPDDPGYAAAAVRQSQSSGITFSMDAPAPEVELAGGAFYAPFLIVDGTVEQVLNDDPTDDPNILFNFTDANPLGFDHIQRLGANTFGFEDLLGGGDQDYNDAVLQINLQVL